MSSVKYIEYENLENFAAAVEISIQVDRSLNYFVSGQFSPESIKKCPLSDVTDTAQKWRAESKPNDLYINHGEFIKDGLEHIISELSSKSDSNRALYSLISQDHVSSSGDNPIPSFMIFQCLIQGNILYCTAYFRALEVCNFLRINLEEMRLNICAILDKFTDISHIRLSIFAFSAYKKPDQITLEKCKIDLLSELEIDDLFKAEPRKIPELLLKKAKQTTVVELDGLKKMRNWLDPQRKDNLPKKLNSNYILSLLDTAIKDGEDLSRLRKSGSHKTSIEEAAIKYVKSVKSVAEGFDND